ncbi:RNA polymerase sigma factor [Altericroceibacterium spongiae]|uniref:RNA polymerase sigma factor n=1 Tax=Altericroceibacterium spongiae TaxID=2320269 RepID=A0A420EPR7_9SPHN|nr:RNA polymerase sigma factor [Altericroceibacterium spongiae]RKF22669.1 RNA polymerase sigma factor [Altericroceibacterium spongiae]
MAEPQDVLEADLIEQVKAGRRKAFDRLVEPHAFRLLTLARRMLASPSEAEEAVQTALASVWIGRERLDTARALGPYLTTTVLNKCRDRLRRRKAARFLGFGYGLEEVIATDHRPGPENTAANREELMRVQQEIECLPVRLREALILVTIDGRSQREAAILLGVSEKTIETRIYRARKRLREKLNFPEG